MWSNAGISSVFVSVYVLSPNVTVAVYVLTPASVHVASVVTSFVIVALTSCICDSSFPQINLAVALLYSFHTHTKLPSLWPVAAISSVFVSVYVFPPNTTVAVYVLTPTLVHVGFVVT